MCHDHETAVDARPANQPPSSVADDALRPDPACDDDLYPPVEAWLPVRRAGRGHRVARRGPMAARAVVTDVVRAVVADTAAPVLLAPDAPHADALAFPRIEATWLPQSRDAIRSAGSPGETATGKPVSQSAFLVKFHHATPVTRCTINSDTASWGVEMHKPLFSEGGLAARHAVPGAEGARPLPGLQGFASTLPPLASNERLSLYGARWLQALPVAVRPVITAKRHPHIVNKFAVLWGDADAVVAYFDDLLISSRPGRRGFAIEVLDELVELQRAFQETFRLGAKF